MGRSSRLAIGADRGRGRRGTGRHESHGRGDRAGPGRDPARPRGPTRASGGLAASRSPPGPRSSPSGWRSTPPAAALLDRPPDGDGPWAMTVEATGSPRDGQQVATLARSPVPPSDSRSLRAFRAIPRSSAAIASSSRVASGPDPTRPTATYLERIGAVGTLDVAHVDGAGRPDDPGRRLEALRRGAGDALTPGPPRTRGRACGGDPDRPPRAGRP